MSRRRMIFSALPTSAPSTSFPMLGELLEPMEGAQELAVVIAQKYPEYKAMAEAVHSERNGDGLDSRQK